MAFIRERIGDGGVHPRTALVGVVLKISIGVIVDGRHNVNGIGNWVNDNRRTTSAIIVVS